MLRNSLKSWKLISKRFGMIGFVPAPLQHLNFHTSSKLYLKKADASEKSIEQQYQRKNQREHILSRPDSYVGTITPSTHYTHFLFDSSQQSIIYSEISNYVRALYRIIDELIVNSVDNFQRPKTGTNHITLQIDTNYSLPFYSTSKQHFPLFHIKNNGKSIPIVIHKKENVYVPELVFGELLTSSNFDDNEVKYTGGRNGYGAKLANIFSHYFRVEIADTENKLLYIQEWSHNMSQKSTPQVIPLKEKKEAYIMVSVLPDYEKFGLAEQGLSPSFINLFHRRMYDIAACNAGLQVSFNSNPILVNSFKNFVALFYNKEEEEQSFLYKKLSKKWEIAIGKPISAQQHHHEHHLHQISFVNSIATVQGGTHIQYLNQQLVRKISDYIATHYKELLLEVKPQTILNHCFLFVNCRIENPSFDSQTKETLTTKSTFFAEDAEISDAVIKELAKETTIIEDIVDSIKRGTKSANAKPKKKEKTLSIPKLYDANYAGTNKSQDCTLILTEGDSARALAIAGLSVVGRDYYGVFPLRGKLLNVREASKAQIEKNQEFQSLIRILGLQMNVTYEPPFTTLRYGKVMLMCDQDHDGSHIKGLFINMMHYFFPSLLQNQYIEEFITPIIKIHLPKLKETKSFFSVAECKDWMSKHVDLMDQAKIKYYKGLGTSTSQEAKEYFSNLNTHQIQFVWNDKSDASFIELAFSKDKVTERKKWVTKPLSQEEYLDHSKGQVSISDFINKELILFSQYDNQRSIPNLIDGLKPSQRKILYCCFKRNLTDEIKVAQLAGYVSEHSAYHHGEQSLHSTITSLAQSFVGSNNIPLLYPGGQFGTRLQGGKDAASARYIFTRLNRFTRFIFREEDDAILQYKEEDGQLIEPEFYVPILPMLLVNGAEGMGTGYSTSIPSYNPLHLIELLLLKLDSNDTVSLPTLTPWMKGYKGTIFQVDDKKFATQGIVSIDYKLGTVTISELPIGKWTDDYKETLVGLMDSPSSFFEWKGFKEYHTENSVHFELQMAKTHAASLKSKYTEKTLQNILIKDLKLETFINTSNMVVFDVKSQLQQYPSALEMLDEFFKVRLQFYGKRKQFMLNEIGKEVELLKNQIQFLELVLQGEIALRQQSKSQLIQSISSKGIKTWERIKQLQQDTNDEIRNKSYDYLINIPLWHLTEDNVNKMKNKLADAQSKFNTLNKKTTKQLWKEDLLQLKTKLETSDDWVW